MRSSSFLLFVSKRAVREVLSNGSVALTNNLFFPESSKP
jgi:hypothetical protein